MITTLNEPAARSDLVVHDSKVAEVISSDRFNDQFQMGVLASFESFSQTATWAYHTRLNLLLIICSSVKTLSVLRKAELVIQRREGTEVIYSLAIPEVRDLLLAARVILTSMRGAQAELVDELSRPLAGRSGTER